MKIVCYLAGSTPHKKNYESLERMCSLLNISLEFTRDFNRLTIPNYNILISFFEFVDPSLIPLDIKIIYGPQFFVFPSGPIIGKLKNELVGRCVYNCLSDWIKDVYLELSDSFIIPLTPLPFSVDTEKFKPLSELSTISELSNNKKRYDFLVYFKRRTFQLLDNTISLLNNKKLSYKIFEYGFYTEDDYLDSLQNTKSMIVLDAHESQGFALEEAMSCNVPLIVIDSTTMHNETNCQLNERDKNISYTYSYLKNNKLLSTSVPYWSDNCGIKITNENILSDAIDLMLLSYEKFKPRDYILNNLSDKICMERILSYFKININELKSNELNKSNQANDKKYTNSLVSIIIPTYNRYDFLINCIRSCLSQTYIYDICDIEIIIVDDCSTDPRYKDGSLELYPKTKVIHLPINLKEKYKVSSAQGLTRNEGLKIAKGEWIAFLDDDDFYLPNKIEIQIKAMTQHNSLFSATNMFIVDHNYISPYKLDINIKSLYLNISNTYFTKEIIEKNNYINNSSVIIHRNIIEKVGDFKLGNYEDWKYWLKVLDYTNCLYINSPLVYYTIDPKNKKYYMYL